MAKWETAKFIACLPGIGILSKTLSFDDIVNKYKKYSIEVTIQCAENNRKEMSQEQDMRENFILMEAKPFLDKSNNCGLTE
jgi:hypothetical protein